MKIKSLCIFGTRPEAIKMAPLIKKLNNNLKFENIVCLTGQHTDLLEPILDLFEIIPDFNIKVMSANQSLSELTSKILEGIDTLLKKIKPHIILVHGDTTTSFTAALTAYYHKIPVAHIEAGLRTGNIFLPWPEEGNRKLTAMISTLHFAPTEQAKSNLLKEGISEKSIHVTGNTVVDALKQILYLLENNPETIKKLMNDFHYLKNKQTILVTSHRRENFGSGLKKICEALTKIAHLFPSINIVFPVHPNPNVFNPIHQLLDKIPNIYLISPLDYLSFVYLMKSSIVILTDSGGIQEEAPTIGTPVLVMRKGTERPEALANGSIKLIGTETSSIILNVEKIINNPKKYLDEKNYNNPYGDGKAAEKIMNIIEYKLNQSLKDNYFFMSLNTNSLLEN